MSSAKLKFSNLGALAGQTEDITDKALRAIGLAIQEEAQTRAPRDTSALANSIYTETSRDSGRERAVAAAKGANEGAGIASAVPIGKGQAKVAVAVEYGAYVELGTRHMDAQPYLTPAVTTIEGEAEAIAARAVADAIKRAGG